MKYSELITLDVIECNSICNNAKYYKLIVPNQKCSYVSIFDWVQTAEIEKKYNTFNYLKSKITVIIYTMTFKAWNILSLLHYTLLHLSLHSTLNVITSNVKI